MFCLFICKHTIPSAQIISSENTWHWVFWVLELSAILQDWNYFRLGRQPGGKQGYPQQILCHWLSFPGLYGIISFWYYPTWDKNKASIQVTAHVIKKYFAIWTHTNRIIISHKIASISTKQKCKFLPKICVLLHLVIKTERKKKGTLRVKLRCVILSQFCELSEI